MPKMAQLEPHIDTPHRRKILKKAANKFMRKQGKRFLDDAPKKKPWQGYT
jgi:hypothetical protein